MAEVLAELVAKIKADTTQFKQGTKSAETSMGRLKKTVTQHSKAIGMGMIAMGTAIVGSMAMSIKAYASAGDAVQKMALRTGFSTEMLSELRHAADLSGTSLSSIDKAAKRMSKTIVDASEGMATYIRAFDRIGLSAEELMGLKPEEQFDKIAMAIAGLEDHALKAATAQDIFGRAGTELLPMLAEGAEGLAEMRQEAHELGLVFDQEAADKAAKFNDDLTRLKGSIQGVAVAIAGPLIDALEPAINFIKDATTKVKDWMKEHPGLTKAIALTTAALGLLLIPLGTLLIFLPTLISLAPIVGIAFHAMLGPIGIITAAIVGLIAVGVLLWKNWEKVTGFAKAHWDKILAYMLPVVGIPILIIRNWDKIVHFFKMAWGSIKIYFLEGVKAVLGALSQFTGWIPFLGDKVDEAREKIANMIEAEKVERDLMRVERALEKNEEALESQGVALDRWHQQLLDSGEALDSQDMALDRWHQRLLDERDALKENEQALQDRAAAMADMVSDVESLLGKEARSLSDFYSKWEDAARDSTESQKRELERQGDAYRDAHGERMRQLDARYDAELKFIDMFLASEVKGYQDQIDKIDKTLEEGREAEEERRDKERIAELEARISTEKDADKRGELQKDLQDFLADLERKRWEDALKEDQDALREQIALARQRASENKDRAQEEYDLKVETENKKLQVQLSQLQKQKELLDHALAEEKARIEEQLQVFRDMNLEKIEDTTAFVDAYNSLLNELKDKVVTVTTVHQSVGGVTGPGGRPVRPAPPLPPVGVPWLQHGGIVTQPTVGLLGEAGPEAIIPLSRGGLGGDIHLHFNGHTFLDREDSMNKFIEKLRPALRRADRLNYGGAYTG